MWVLGIKPRSSARAPSVLNYRTISPALNNVFLRLHRQTPSLFVSAYPGVVTGAALWTGSRICTVTLLAIHKEYCLLGVLFYSPEKPRYWAGICPYFKSCMTLQIVLYIEIDLFSFTWDPS